MAAPLLLALVLVQGPTAPAPAPQWDEQLIGLALGGAPELAQPHKVYVQSGSWLSQAPSGGAGAAEIAPRPAAAGPMLLGGSLPHSCYGTGYNSPDYGFYRGASETDRSCQVQRSSDEQIARNSEAGRKAQKAAAAKAAARLNAPPSNKVPFGYSGQLPSTGGGVGGGARASARAAGGSPAPVKRGGDLN
jgi:hypothetical protein